MRSHYPHAAVASGDNMYPMKRIYSATAAPAHNPEPHSEIELNQDEADIARYGKKQQFKVRFSH